MFDKLKETYKQLWQAIIRPPRSEYRLEDLGPTKWFQGDTYIKRTDIDTIRNKKNQRLKCSWFQPMGANQPLPCVIYLHGNSSSRMEGLNVVPLLQPDNISVLCFDFAGSGMSDGEYISQGYYERDDLDCVIDYLRESKMVSTIGLWGRSMGAVTALMHADRDPSIGCQVQDSPFSNQHDLSMEQAKRHSGIPEFILSIAISYIRKTIQEKANFDINDQNPLKNNVGKCFSPCFFLHGKDDELIDPQHCVKLYEAYVGEKKFKMVDGTHNTERDFEVQNEILMFFHNCLRVDQQVDFSYGGNKKVLSSNPNQQSNYYQTNSIGLGKIPLINKKESPKMMPPIKPPSHSQTQFLQGSNNYVGQNNTEQYSGNYQNKTESLYTNQNPQKSKGLGPPPGTKNYHENMEYESIPVYNKPHEYDSIPVYNPTSIGSYNVKPQNPNVEYNKRVSEQKPPYPVNLPVRRISTPSQIDTNISYYSKDTDEYKNSPPFKQPHIQKQRYSDGNPRFSGTGFHQNFPDNQNKKY